jgi:hypothetical protein
MVCNPVLNASFYLCVLSPMPIKIRSLLLALANIYFNISLSSVFTSISLGFLPFVFSKYKNPLQIASFTC